MDTKELADKNFEDNKHFLEEAIDEIVEINGPRSKIIAMKKNEAFIKRVIKQARIDALEESAKLADDCAGHYSPECECMNIAKAIRALKEK